MDCSPSRRYNTHEWDSRSHLDYYFSDKPENVFADDTLVFPIECLTKTFSEGNITGDILIDLSVGSLIHQLYSACECFKHIIIMKTNDRCIMELKRWAATRTGAFEWGHATKLHVGTGDSDQFQEKEENVKSALQQVLKCDFDKENMTDPIVLPPADCIISAWLLDVISRDQDDYMRYLRKFLRCLKPGAHFILVGLIDATYYTIRKERFQFFTYDEEFVRKALTGEGLVIDDCKFKKRTAISDIIDYKGMIFIDAHKEK